MVVGDGFAGTEMYVCRAALACAERGLDVVVVGGSPARMRAALGSTVTWLPGSTLRRAGRSLFCQGRVDVVHAHMTAAEVVAASLRGRNHGLFVCTRHFAAERGKTLPGRVLSPWVNKALDRQIAISQFVADRLDSPPNLVLRHGVVARERPPQPPTRRVLLLQRLESEKDTATAVRAWAESRLGERGWQLRIAGQGRERKPLEALAEQLDVRESVRFLGFVDDPTLELGSAAILVATAPAEPFGLSVLEAMSLATPVVATAYGGHLETVGTAARPALFPPGDVAALSGLLLALADDEARRAAYGDELQALQRERFSLDEHITRLIDLYDGVP